MEGSITFAWICIGLILLVGAAVLVRRGAAVALGVTVVLAFAFPTWLQVPIFGAQMPIRTVVALAGLLAFTLRDPRQLISPLTLLDVLIASMVGVHFASDVFHGWDAVSAGFMSYGEWAVPYVAGRYALRSAGFLESLAMCVCGVLVILGIGGILETLSGINPWEAIFGERPVDGFNREASRFGFKRAFGPTMHPIYFGLLILVLTPWSIALLPWARTRLQQTFAVASTVASLGMFATLSRGPAIAWATMVIGLGAIWVRWYRWVLGAVTAAIVIWISLNFSSFVTMLDQMAGEKSRVTKISLDGERVELSSFRHRIVLLQVFWPAMKDAGLLGYGSNAMKSLPPDVPHLPADETARKSLKYVDNAFVFYVLRFGWLGATIFTLLIAGATYTAIRLSWDRSIGILTGATASMLVSMALALVTVWFSYDFGFELLWMYGILAGLASYDSK